MDSRKYEWQDEFIAKYHALNQQDFTLVACPASGKTRAALKLARELFDTGIIDFLWIVAPTRRVKKQWWTTAGQFGIELDWKWENSDGQVPSDMNGAIVTFGAVSSQPDLQRMIISRHRTLVIFDEIHHARDEAAWGDRCQHAFENATRRLMLSGTPFRHDKERISFLRYEPRDGQQWLAADYTYGYVRAFQNGTCRFPYFPKRGGTVEWEWRNQDFKHTFEDKLDDPKARARLRAAISADSVTINPHAEQLLRDADNKISQLRAEGDDNAGGLVVAMGWDKESSMRHANAVADHMERMFRRRPPVVVSDEPGALAKIDAFENGTERWLVSINMVSEGVDIPRLRVLAHLTNNTSEVHFHQVVGRVLRGTGDAHVYIMDDPLLRQYAQVFQEQRQVALDEIDKRPRDGGSGGEPDPSGFKSLGGETEDAGVIFGSHRIDRDEYVAARGELENAGWPPPVPHEVIGKFIVARGRQRDPSAEQHNDAGQKSERKERLRQEQNRLVRAYCYRTGREYSHVNNALSDSVGIRKLRHATEDQLIDRLKLAQELYESGRET